MITGPGSRSGLVPASLQYGKGKARALLNYGSLKSYNHFKVYIKKVAGAEEETISGRLQTVRF